MFEQTFVPRGARGRSPAALAISLAGQSVIVLCLLIVPLLRPQAMRYVMQHSILEPPRKVEKPIEMERRTPHELVSRNVFRPSTLLAPRRVPQRIAMMSDPVPELMPGNATAEAASGVPGVFNGLGEVVMPQPPAAAPIPPAKKPPSRVRVSSTVQQALLTSQVKPVYPALARSARVAGSVVLQAVIGKDGSIQNLQLVSGHPLLARAALDAVAQWRYRPTLLSGEPVEVATQIVVNFVLNQ